MKTKTMQLRIQTARAVSPVESDGVVERAELNMFTKTLNSRIGDDIKRGDLPRGWSREGHIGLGKLLAGGESSLRKPQQTSL